MGLRDGQRPVHLRHAKPAPGPRAAISGLVGTDDTILYSSCFDANGGVFETLFGEQDAIISDELNHASIIDGIRLSKAARYRYRNADLADLEAQLQAAAGAHRRVVVTDGVFSMDGSYAPLPGICELARRYDALVLVDDSHAIGFVGATGGGTPEMFGVQDQVDIVTGTLGKALGARPVAMSAGHQEVVDLLRQRSRPYLFSNSVAPAVVAGSLTAVRLAREAGELQERLAANATLFRSLMTQAGFDLLPGSHPITPVMFPGEDGARRRPPSPTTCSPTGCTSSRSRTLWSRWAGPGSGSSSAAHSAADVGPASTPSGPPPLPLGNRDRRRVAPGRWARIGFRIPCTHP